MRSVTPPLKSPPFCRASSPPKGRGGAPQKHITSQLRLYIKFTAGMPLWVFCMVQNLGLLGGMGCIRLKK